ncbi:alpha-amylase family glycosyl hydrolase [Phytoactinopolyspora endophytica]|uniref:alpha-amylase family glycosyl hydrolase n=1 Tax=Phytoactinopolyspora endophytica TaxID=1642495 RepID=UPI00197BA54C|nr:alpha-amylase family glycosyl hydrolase [Phytoactinopolyspora endophytica]
MEWSTHAIWWHVYPLGFVGAEREALSPGSPAVSRLPKLAGWLDYLVELGCNGLALGPVFASETHGYDTVDHFRIDGRLGDEDDLVRLIEQSHARGVRVLLDGVFNHVGRGFPAFEDVLKHGSDSRFASWFQVDSDGDYRTFEGHDRLVVLNHDAPAVVDYVSDVMSHWLDRGVDGWRLDAAYTVPVSFWHQVTTRVRARHPGAWFVGEVIHGEYGAFVQDGGLDSVTQYELWKAIWSSLNDHNLHELSWTLGRHNALLGTFTPQTFLGNHDVTRIASRLDDERHLEHALVVLLTVGGVPSVYAGDEQAFRGIKEEREGGDDAIRPAFPDTPDGLAVDGWGYYRLHQLLIGLRRRHPWLVSSRATVHALTNTSIVYTVGEGEEWLAVALNIGEQPVDLGLPTADWQRVAGTGELTADLVTLPPAGWSIAVAGSAG